MHRLLHGVVSILSWAAVAVLGLFGIYFTFANYPVFGIAVTLSALVLIAYFQRNRRQRHRASERARRRNRAQHRPLDG